MKPSDYDGRGGGDAMEMPRWVCEWKKMQDFFDAPTRGKARYAAYKVLREYWNDVRLIDIKVWRKHIVDA